MTDYHPLAAALGEYLTTEQDVTTRSLKSDGTAHEDVETYDVNLVDALLQIAGALNRIADRMPD